jgi:tetratricopeptide (TPR) repeat protein
MPETMTKKDLALAVYFALAVSTLIVFWQVRNFDFITFDDNFYVYDNPHVLNGLTAEDIIWAFTTGHTGYWHPLTWLSLMLDCQLFGPNPGRIHFVSLLFHIANTLLLFALLKKMTDALWPSAFVAAAFALHPMHVESVAWISERKDVLSTLFFLLTLLAYAAYVKRGSLFSYLAAVLLFALGLMAKPMLVTLPFILLLLDYWPLERFEFNKSAFDPDKRAATYRIIIEKIPFFVLAAIVGVFTFLVQRSVGSLTSIASLPLESRLANACLSYIKYVNKIFWPHDLAIFYPFEGGSVTLLHLLSLVIATIVVFRFRQNRRYLPVGWLWFIITLLPVIGLIQTGKAAYADRYTYIAYIGLFIMVGWGIPELISKWPHRKIILGILMLAVLTPLAAAARQQVGYWKNTQTVFSHALAVTQNNYLPHLCLAFWWNQQGRLDEACEQYRAALELNPYPSDKPAAMAGLAWCMAVCPEIKNRDVNEAVNLARGACELTNYDKPVFLDALAAAYAAAGKFSEAVKTAKTAIKLADAGKQPQLKDMIQHHLSFYTQGKPYVECGQKSEPNELNIVVPH